MNFGFGKQKQNQIYSMEKEVNQILKEAKNNERRICNIY